MQGPLNVKLNVKGFNMFNKGHILLPILWEAGTRVLMKRKISCQGGIESLSSSSLSVILLTAVSSLYAVEEAL